MEDEHINLYGEYKKKGRSKNFEKTSFIVTK